MWQRAVVIAGILLASAILGVAIFEENGFLHYLDMRREVRVYQRDIVKLSRKNTALETELSRLRHDEAYMLQLVRDKLSMIRDGEVLVHFIE